MLLKIEDYSESDLLQTWRRSGLSQRELARRMGWNFNAMHGKIFRAQKEEEKTLNSVEDVESGNYRTISSNDPRITTVEDLLKHCKIDTEEWIVEKATVNMWEGYRKGVVKDLNYVEGKVDGFIKDSGMLDIEPLYQVKVTLVRRNPINLSPVVSPIKHSIDYSMIKRTPEPKESDTLEKALILADPHFGFIRDLYTGELNTFHDREALSIILSICSQIYFDKIIVAGDVLDLAEWSDRFVRGPEMYWTTQPAIHEAAWFLSQIRLRQPHAVISVLKGNHGKRMEDYLMKHAYQAYGLRQANGIETNVVSIPYLLGLDDLNIEFVGNYPDGRVWINDVTSVIHGSTAKAKPGLTASSVIEKEDVSVIFGHIHRHELATRNLNSKNGSREIVAYTPGCLCKVDGTVPGSSTSSNWQQGAGIIYYDDEQSFPITIPIRNGVGFFGESVFEAWDYTSQLRLETNYNF